MMKEKSLPKVANLMYRNFKAMLGAVSWTMSIKTAKV